MNFHVSAQYMRTVEGAQEPRPIFMVKKQRCGQYNGNAVSESLLVYAYAHISSQPRRGGGRPPGNPRGTHGLGEGFAAKICPRDRGIRVLLTFWQNSPGIYPRDLLMLCFHEVQQ